MTDFDLFTFAVAKRWNISSTNEETEIVTTHRVRCLVLIYFIIVMCYWDVSCDREQVVEYAFGNC